VGYLKRKEAMRTITDYLNKKDKEDIKDIANHGCSGGVSGLIYYHETSDFYDEHRTEIWEMLEDSADQEGVTLMEKVYALTKDEESYRTFKNKLVWWAVEVRAQELQVKDAVAVGQALKQQEDVLPSATGTSEPTYYVKVP
tara:strand:+ start:267 stop:689 length:423 start_codon:yes stop_codon:yes gene_type:complete